MIFLYAIVRTGSLGVQSSLRHRSYSEPWRSKLFAPSSVWGREPWRQSCVRHWAVCGPEGSHQRPYWSLGVKNLSRHCKLLVALVLRAFYVTARSWEPWCSEMFTLPLALGSLGVQSSLRHRSYWEPRRSKLFTPSFVQRVLAFKTVHAIVRMGAGTLASKLCPSLGRVWA